MPAVAWDERYTYEDVAPVRPQDTPTAVPDPPDLMDIAASALRQNSTITNLFPGAVDYTSRLMENPIGYLKAGMKDIDAPREENLAPVEGYSPFDDPRLDDVHPDDYFRFIESRSPAETRQIIGRMRTERADQDLIRRAGAKGLAVSLAAGLTDPVTLLAMTIPAAAPVAWGSRAARIGAVAGAGILVDTAQETVLHANQETRTLEDSLFNIGAGAILNSGIGAWATRVPKSEFDLIRREIATGVNQTAEGVTSAAETAAIERALRTAPDSVGAAKVGTTLDDETIAKGGQLLARALRWANPLNRLMTSSSVEVRQLTQRLLDIPYLLKKNERGVANPDSIEGKIKQRMAHSRIEVVRLQDEAHAAYRDRMKASGQKAMGLREFGFMVSKAMRRGDADPVPEVAQAARRARKLFDADRKAFEELGVLPEDAEVLGARSYFPRVYDHHLIEQNQLDFADRLRKWFRENPKRPVEDKATKEARTRLGEQPDAKVQEATTALEDARTASKEAVKEVVANRRAKKLAASQLRKAERVVDGLDQRLTELETQLKHLDEDMSGATEAQMIERQGRLQADIERTRARAIKAEERRQKLLDDAVEVDQNAIRLKAAAKDARQAAKEAAKAAKAVKEDAAAVAKYEKALADSRKPRSDAEIEQDVQDAINHIKGTVRGSADVPLHGKSPRVLKSRVLDVPDEVLEPYLVSDFDQVMQGYLRSVVPEIEFRREFGSTDLAAEIEELQAAYNVKKATAKTSKEAADLDREFGKAKRDLERIRDRLLNRVGPRGNEAMGLIRTGRILRGYNYVRLLGGQTVSSVSDVGRLVSRYGLARTTARLGKFLTSMKANRMIREDAHRLGTALDWWIDSRTGTLADVGDELSGGRGLWANAERLTQETSQRFTRYSLMATWNSVIKSVTASLEQDAIIRAATGTAKNFDRAKLASHGITDDYLRIIKDQFEKYGETESGLNMLRTELWDRKDAAALVERAVLKSADMMALTKGAGDLPLFMDREVAKTLLQFKSFGMTSVNRLLIPMAQGLAHKDVAAANGLMVMLTLGGMTYVAKEYAAGREPDMSPTRLGAEALNWSGALAFLPDVWDPVSGVLFEPFRGMRFSRYSDRSPIETLMGPTFGTATEAYKTLSGITAPASEEDPFPSVSAKDAHQVRKMLPLQNLFYIRRLVNALEGEFSEAIGAEGATDATFWDRATETAKPEK